MRSTPPPPSPPPPILTQGKGIFLNPSPIVGIGTINSGLIVKDGIGHTVTNVATINVTSGGTISQNGTEATEADLAISGGGPGTGIGTIVAGGIVSSATLVALGDNPIISVPAAAGFGFINQHSATLTDNANGPLVWSCPTALGSDALSLVGVNVPAASDFTYTVNAMVSAIPNAVPIPIGLTDGTKVTALFVVAKKSGTQDSILSKQNWTNVTTAAGGNVNTTIGAFPDRMWYRVSWANAAHTITWQVSIDGVTWFTLATDSVPFLTPTQFVFGGYINIGSTTFPTTVSVNRLVQT